MFKLRSDNLSINETDDDDDDDDDDDRRKDHAQWSLQQRQHRGRHPKNVGLPSGGPSSGQRNKWTKP